MPLDIASRPRFLRTDLHLHSTFSDGHSDVPTLVARANSIGFVFTVSDHYSRSQQMHDDRGLAAYLDTLERYPVYHAVEMDLGDMLPMSEANLARLDYRIGSMHNAVDDHGAAISLTGNDATGAAADRYMEYYLDAFRRDVITGAVQMIGHPTYLPGTPGHLHERLWTEPRRRAYIEAVVEGGVALEISTRYSVPSPVMLREALEAGARFAVGSDSHWLDRTAVIDLPLRYIKEYDIPEDRFFLPARVIEPPTGALS